MDNMPTLIKGGLASDDRGVVRFVNDFRFEGVKRFYVLENWQPGFVRAWHGHMRETKWVTVMHGTALVCTIPVEKIDWIHDDGSTVPSPSWAVQKFVMSQDNPAVLYIPPGYANGSMALVDGTQVTHFSSMTMDETAGDDLRWPWDTIPGVWEVQQR